MIFFSFFSTFIHSYGVITFYLTSMLFRLLVVVDAHEKYVADVFCNLRDVVFCSLHASAQRFVHSHTIYAPSCLPHHIHQSHALFC